VFLCGGFKGRLTYLKTGYGGDKNLRRRKLIEDYRKSREKLHTLFSSSNKIRVIEMRLGWTCSNMGEGKNCAGNFIIWNT
jgi:hypothetical protein